MQKYILRRLALMVPTLFGLTVLVFIMVRLLPGDVVTLILGDFGASSPEVREAMIRDFGLDENIPVQYVRWFGNIATGDLGSSLVSGRPVTEEIGRRLPISLQLGLTAIVFSVLIGVPIGTWSAIRQNSFVDYAGRSLAIGLLAAPNFWIALLLIAMAGRYFQWGVPPTTYPHLTDDPVANIRFIIVPALLIGGAASGSVMRFTRTSMLEVLRQDYVRTAWAKGLREQTIIMRHVLKNAMIPVVTVVGLSIPGIITGSVIIEQVYSIPGMGRYYLQAINRVDLPVIQGIVLVFGLAVLLVNLAVDLSYSWLNPRIRYS